MQEIISVINDLNLDKIDWETLVGAVATCIVTWVAIFKTSELDRKARIFENKFTNYLDVLIELKLCLFQIMELNDMYIQNRKGGGCYISSDEISENLKMLDNTKQFLDSAKTYSPKNVKLFENVEDLVGKYIEMFKSIRDTLDAFLSNSNNNDYYVKRDNDIIILFDKFHEQYPEQYKPELMNEKYLKEMEKFINQELKMD